MLSAKFDNVKYNLVLKLIDIDSKAEKEFAFLKDGELNEGSMFVDAFVTPLFRNKE